MKVKNIYSYLIITILLCSCSHFINITASSDLGNATYSNLNAFVSSTSDNDLNISTNNLKEIPFLDMSEFSKEKKKRSTDNTNSNKKKSIPAKRQKQNLKIENTIKEDFLIEKKDTVQVLNSQKEDVNTDTIMIASSCIKAKGNKNLNSIKQTQKDIHLNKNNTQINKNISILIFCIFSLSFILFVQFLLRGIR